MLLVNNLREKHQRKSKQTKFCQRVICSFVICNFHLCYMKNALVFIQSAESIFHVYYYQLCQRQVIADEQVKFLISLWFP